MTIFKEPPKRTKQFRILLTEQEKAALDAAAIRFGITTSDLIREAVNDPSPVEIPSSGLYASVVNAGGSRRARGAPMIP
jgi:hypothetical protein